MNFEEGKNFKFINEFGIWHDIYLPTLGKEYPMRIYDKFDLLVDGEITESPEDFWAVILDLDGETFAIPISGLILAEKLMNGWVPLKKDSMKKATSKIEITPKQQSNSENLLMFFDSLTRRESRKLLKKLESMAKSDSRGRDIYRKSKNRKTPI